MVVLLNKCSEAGSSFLPLIIPLPPHFTHLPLSSQVPSSPRLGGEGWGGEGNLGQRGAGYLRFQRNRCSDAGGTSRLSLLAVSPSAGSVAPEGPCHSPLHRSGAWAISKWHAVVVPLSLWGLWIIFSFSLKMYEAVVVSESMPSHPELIDWCHPVITQRDKLIRFCSRSSSCKWPD